MLKEVIQGIKMAKVVKTIEEEQGNPDRDYYGKEQNLIDRVSVVTYLNNFLRVIAAPLKPGQAGNLWKVDGVAEATDAIMAHLDRRAKILREKGESAI